MAQTILDPETGEPINQVGTILDPDTGEPISTSSGSESEVQSGIILDPETGEPISDELTNEPEDDRSGFGRLVDQLFTPPEFVSKGYDWLREHPEITRNIPIVGTEIPRMSGEEPYKPVLALMEMMSTPGDAALSLGTGGMGMIPKVGRGLQKIAGGLLAGRGAERIATGESLGEKGVGALELLGGGFGMRVPGRTPSGRITGAIDETPTPSKKSVFDEELIPEVSDISHTPEGRLLAKLDESEPLNVEQAEKYSQELRKRLGRMEEVDTPGIAGHYQKKARLAGEYEKVEIKPLELGIDDVDSLRDHINTHPDLLELEKINAVDGLMKLNRGRVPIPYEIKQLSKAFGRAFEDKMIKLAGKKTRSTASKLGKVVRGLQDFQRSILTAYDFSAPGRQGKFFWTEPAWIKSFPTMIKSWGSKNFFESAQKSIFDHPNFQRPRVGGKVVRKSYAERAELDTTDLLANREEKFRSTFAEKWFPGVAASQRAYVGFLNKLRSDVFNSMLGDLKKAGYNIEDDKLLRQVGSFINDATGRGKLPTASLEKHANLMNDLFFAPRLHAGKLRLYGRLFNPKFYTQTNPVVRKKALRSLLASASFGLATGELFRQMGASVSNDPTSADFRKIRIGDRIRIDPFGGDQQYAVLMARMLMGKTTSSTTGESTALRENLVPGKTKPAGQFGGPSFGSVAGDFAANRLAPVPSMIFNLMWDRSYGSDEFGVQSELIDKTVPIVMQDFWEIVNEDPSLAPLIVPAMFGVGTQVYGRD